LIKLLSTIHTVCRGKYSIAPENNVRAERRQLVPKKVGRAKERTSAFIGKRLGRSYRRAGGAP